MLSLGQYKKKEIDNCKKFFHDKIKFLFYSMFYCMNLIENDSQVVVDKFETNYFCQLLVSIYFVEV